MFYTFNSKFIDIEQKITIYKVKILIDNNFGAIRQNKNRYMLRVKEILYCIQTNSINFFVMANNGKEEYSINLIIILICYLYKNHYNIDTSLQIYKLHRHFIEKIKEISHLFTVYLYSLHQKILCLY